MSVLSTTKVDDGVTAAMPKVGVASGVPVAVAVIVRAETMIVLVCSSEPAVLDAVRETSYVPADA